MERRKKVGPTVGQNMGQRLDMLLAVISIVGLLIYCTLEPRFGWSPVPVYVSLVGDVLVTLGLPFIFMVFRENSFGASTVQILKQQTVISTGPYVVVRHPMYVEVLVIMTAVPLALGSWTGLAVARVRGSEHLEPKP